MSDYDEEVESEEPEEEPYVPGRGLVRVAARSRRSVIARQMMRSRNQTPKTKRRGRRGKKAT